MSDRDEVELVLEFEIEAPPAKIWRAVTIPEYRNRWLPGKTLVDGEPLDVKIGRSVRYQLHDDKPPFGQSEVTFEVEPGTNGHSIFRITHTRPAANDLLSANCNAPLRACRAAA